MKSSAPTISVLMAVYDTPVEYLEASVTSIIAQTFDDFEFIIVDDGSGDATRSRLREYAARDQRIRLYCLESNIGLTRALNEGLSKARGKYIARQDADDLSSSARLEEMYQFLEAHPDLAAAGSNAVLIDEAGNKFGVANISPNLEGMLRRNILIHGSMMFRRDTFDQVGAYDDRMRLSQDYELYLRMIRLHGMRLGVMEKELYLLRQHSDSISSRKMFKQLYYSVLAKSLTLPGQEEKWRRQWFFLTEFIFDLVFTHRLLLGPALRRYLFSRSRPWQF